MTNDELLAILDGRPLSVEEKNWCISKINESYPPFIFGLDYAATDIEIVERTLDVIKSPMRKLDELHYLGKSKR